MAELCPCCNRPLEKMLDYPLVLVRRVEILPIPEVMDYWSEEAARARLTRGEATLGKLPSEQVPLAGINRTPEVASAYQSQAVRRYFRTLESLIGQEVAPARLAPELERDKYFKGAYSLPGTHLYISLDEGEPEDEVRVCRVVFLGQGPNLGSAGGPTLQQFGAVAAVYYEGRLMGQGGQHDG